MASPSRPRRRRTAARPRRRTLHRHFLSPHALDPSLAKGHAPASVGSKRPGTSHHTTCARPHGESGCRRREREATTSRIVILRPSRCCISSSLRRIAGSPGRGLIGNGRGQRDERPIHSGIRITKSSPSIFFKSPRHAPAPVSPLEIESAVDREN
jgi:hypothetical protein